jgi:hypothetical protein
MTWFRINSRFVPAFKGAYGEHEMFSPSIDAFRKSAPLGNAEDRTFFENQLSLEGDFPPYITKPGTTAGAIGTAILTGPAH